MSINNVVGNVSNVVGNNLPENVPRFCRVSDSYKLIYIYYLYVYIYLYINGMLSIDLRYYKLYFN